MGQRPTGPTPPRRELCLTHSNTLLRHVYPIHEVETRLILRAHKRHGSNLRPPYHANDDQPIGADCEKRHHSERPVDAKSRCPWEEEESNTDGKQGAIEVDSRSHFICQLRRKSLDGIVQQRWVRGDISKIAEEDSEGEHHVVLVIIKGCAEKAKPESGIEQQGGPC